MKTLGLKMLTKYGVTSKVCLPVTWHFLGAYLGRDYTPTSFKMIYPAVHLEYTRKVKILSFQRLL